MLRPLRITWVASMVTACGASTPTPPPPVEPDVAIVEPPESREEVRAPCASPLLHGQVAQAKSWFEGDVEQRYESSIEGDEHSYFVGRVTNRVRGEDEVTVVDLRYEGSDPRALLDHEVLLLGVVPVEPHREERSTRTIDGRVVAVVPVHWYGQGESILAEIDAGRCPELLRPRPRQCRGCRPDQCSTGCCEWVDDSCGDDATCSRMFDCNAGCCTSSPSTAPQ